MNQERLNRRHFCRHKLETLLAHISFIRSYLITSKVFITEQVILHIKVDDPHDCPITALLFPKFKVELGHGWKKISHELGYVDRKHVQKVLTLLDKKAATRLAKIDEGVPIVVVNDSRAEIFSFAEVFFRVKSVQT